MTAIGLNAPGARDYRKWALFAVLGALALTAIWADERFLIDMSDPEWKHIAPFKWWLLAHGLAGVTALAIGPLQFSTRMRRRHLGLHRILGRIYIGAIFVAAPLSVYIAQRWDPAPLNAAAWIQAVLWMLCAGLALIYALKRNIPRHQQWMARSYGVTFIFIASRVPDAFHWDWGGLPNLTAYILGLNVAAVVVPDLILQADEAFKRGR